MFQRLIDRNRVVGTADAPCKTGARRRKRLESKRLKIAGASQVPGIGNDEASGLVQLAQCGALGSNWRGHVDWFPEFVLERGGRRLCDDTGSRRASRRPAMELGTFNHVRIDYAKLVWFARAAGPRANSCGRLLQERARHSKSAIGGDSPFAGLRCPEFLRQQLSRPRRRSPTDRR